MRQRCSEVLFSDWVATATERVLLEVAEDKVTGYLGVGRGADGLTRRADASGNALAPLLPSPRLLDRRHGSLYVPVNVSPHLCLLIGQVVARAAVQREGAALPLAVFRHVTLEKASPVRLEPAYVTPGRAGTMITITMLLNIKKYCRRS